MRFLSSLFFLIISQLVMAQPDNNTCSGIIDLGDLPYCAETFFNNQGATAFDIAFENEPNCFVENPPQNDVWFQFTANNEDENYIVSISGNDDNTIQAISNLQAAVYRGSICAPDNLAVFGCGAGEMGENSLSFPINGLTPGDTYYLRIDNFGGDQNEGAFQICIEEKENITDISQGSSTECEGILFDSGGEENNYSDNEDFTFSICPSNFNQCITFDLEYFNLESFQFLDESDQIIFYDGPDVNAPQIGHVGGETMFFDDAGGGGVCYSVQASSGCLTVQFISNGSINFEGFKGSWSCSVQPCEQAEQFAVGSQPTAEEIEAVLSTPFANVSVTNINCSEGSYALFQNSENTDLGIKKGLLLTSGSASNAIGPNSEASTATEWFTDGDEELDTLSNLSGSLQFSMDACVIEVEVQPLTNELNFEYIFGSEEYPEFVDQFNDIFALLIDGPGINGIPQIGNKDNLAVIPGTTTPVEINSVNNLLNWQYYRNNHQGLSLEYDGLTSGFQGSKKSLTARAIVEPCETYTLKFAIADRGDANYDSGVFISEISSGIPDLSFNFASGLDFLTEDCDVGQDFVEITFSEPSEDTLVYYFSYTGTAQKDVDYTVQLPDSLVVLPGEQSFSFPIMAINDLAVEADEDFSINLISQADCGDVNVTSITSSIKDKINVDINLAEDTIFICPNEELILVASGATSYSWTPAAFVDMPNEAETAVNTSESRWYFVNGTVLGGSDPGCFDMDSVFVSVLEPEISITTLDDVNICQFDTIDVMITNNVNNQNLTWNITEGVEDTLANMTSIIAQIAGTDGVDYIVSVDINGCEARDTLTLFVSSFDWPNLISDSTVCQGTPVQLANNVISESTTYTWTPEDFLDDASIAGPTALAEDTITYTLMAESNDGMCMRTDSITLNILPNFVEIMEGDTAFLCFPDSIELSATSSDEDIILEWSPLEIVKDTFGSETEVVPTESGYVYVRLNGEFCQAVDSIWLQVDSLPALAVEAVPAKEKYCPGEVVTLISPSYEDDFFPNIEHQWVPNTGALDEDTLLNFVLITIDTITFVRQTTNGACMSNDSITLNVVQPFLLSSLQDTTVCPGEPVSVVVTSDQELSEISWSPDDETMISCTDCLTPTFTVNSTTVFTISAMADGCPISESITINVFEAPQATYTAEPPLAACLGSTVDLSASLTPVQDPDTEFTWKVNGNTVPSDGLNVTVVATERSNLVELEFIDSNGCPRVLATTVDVEADIPVTLDVEPSTTVCIGSDIQVTASHPYIDAQTSFLWQLNGGDIEQNNNPVNTTAPQPNENTVSVQFEDSFGCPRSAEVVIFATPPSFEVPNAFTPANNDDLNDNWFIYFDGNCNDWEIDVFEIYNRWGKKVWECDNKDCFEEGWDGLIDGQLGPGDTYAMVFRYILPSGETFKLESEIVLIR